MTNVIVYILQIKKVRLQLRNPLTEPLLLVVSNFMRLKPRSVGMHALSALCYSGYFRVLKLSYLGAKEK